eukprot:620233-Amphidinium_carterae.1
MGTSPRWCHVALMFGGTNGHALFQWPFLAYVVPENYGSDGQPSKSFSCWDSARHALPPFVYVPLPSLLRAGHLNTTSKGWLEWVGDGAKVSYSTFVSSSLEALLSEQAETLRCHRFLCACAFLRATSCMGRNAFKFLISRRLRGEVGSAIAETAAKAFELLALTRVSSEKLCRRINLYLKRHGVCAIPEELLMHCHYHQTQNCNMLRLVGAFLFPSRLRTCHLVKAILAQVQNQKSALDIRTEGLQRHCVAIAIHIDASSRHGCAIQ